MKSNDCFPAVFNNDFRAIMNHTYTEYTEAGGRGSCKSTFFSIVIPLLILSNKDYNAIILRKTENTLKDSVYNQLKWSICKLGLEEQFRFLKSPLQIVYKPTGQTIFFRGSDDPLKIKSVKAERGYLAIIWFEELSEFTPSDFESIKLSTMRGGEKFYLFESFNPPSSARNWVNNYIMQPKSNQLVHKTDYRTTPPSWLGEAFLFEAETMLQQNERAYRNVFLGEATGTGLNVFENVTLREITQKEINSFNYLYMGVDWGYYPDPFIWVCFSYDSKERILYVFDELKLYKHGNKEASEALKQHIKDRYYEGFAEERIIADSAEPKSIADFRSYGWNMKASNKFPNSVAQGFKWLQGLKQIIIDPARCPEAADEFSNYEHEIDKRTGEILTGYPDGQADHVLAAARYGLEPIWQRRGN